MRVFVNGEPRAVPEHTTVAALVREAAGAADGRGIAVAVDATVVPHSMWDSTALADGQRVEVLGAIQGG